ncbi:MAG: hypothetical protein ABIE70_10970, partial [bacterium]
IKAIISHVITLLTPLLSHLGGKGLGSNGIVVTLTSVDSLQKQFRSTIDNPTLSVGTFARQLELIMDRNTLKAPISEIEVAIPNENIVALLSRQVFFDSSDHITTDCHSEPELLRILTDHNVRAISMTSAYLPESSYELVGASDIRKAQMPTSQLFPTKGLRLFKQPVETRVTTNNNLPESLNTNHGQYQIIRNRGPWRLSGDWWRSSYDRLYYQLETTNHHRFLTYFDSQDSHWYIQGGYD